MFNIIKKETVFAGKKLVLETGELARMSNMAVKASYGDTIILATAMSGEANPEIDYLPLTLSYEEKLYASGSIKNSRFIKRDGRAGDEAVVTQRMIDHAIRPLFPNDYMDEVSVVITVLSLDENADTEFLAMVATSACLQASNIPWHGPILSAKVSFVNNDYLLNPTKKETEELADLNMMVSFVGKEKLFLAVEAEVNILPEEKVLGAIEFARNNIDGIYDLIEEFSKAVNPDGTKYKYASKALSEDLINDVSTIVKSRIVDMMKQAWDKTKMKAALEELSDEVNTTLEGKYKKSDMSRALEVIEKHALQHLILDEGKRPDGRVIDEIRQIDAKIGVLPRTHGSALFSRGITQALTVTTLGSPALELFIQNMWGEKTKRYIHYFNAPPYSNGEVGRMRGPGLREIGHGMLAEKALRPVIPAQTDFPYTILLVSEILSASGSSSMAATCGSTLALMDAGVPIKAMVAGVGVGLIVNDDMTKQLIMTDLAYKEDSFGFLDFKMTGTRTGVTAIQADMKLAGIPMNLLPKIFEQSRNARMKVLDEMEKIISEPRASVSQYAPKSVSIKINPEKIGMVIGSGGRTIRDIQEKTDTQISIEEDGTVFISGSVEENIKKARDTIEGLTHDVKEGEIYDGVVKEIVDFGAFVEILPGKDGLLHVSEISNTFVKNVNDILSVGETVKVKVLEVGRDGKVSLSKKALEPGGEEGDRPRPMNRHERTGGRRPERRF